MAIRIQVSGGLGNQLFSWAGAHYLVEQYKTKVILIYICDSNSRGDRPLEIEVLSKKCIHNVILRKSNYLGIVFKIIDKCKLESFSVSSKMLERLGLYTFGSPTSKAIFGVSKPQLVRSYFQRCDLVDASWEKISAEISEVLIQNRIKWNFKLKDCTVAHIRRGDTLGMMGTHGLLSAKYFVENSISGQPIVISTDDSKLPTEYKSEINPIAIVSPENASAWQALALMVEGKSFIGSNSTLSWWASYIRVKSRIGDSVLPYPWTKKDLGYEEALRISGIQYKSALFVNREVF